MKGFTLIELLATIVILGLVVFITVPVINNLISSSKEKANYESAVGIFESANIYYQNKVMNFDFRPYSCDFGLSSCSELNYNGVKPNSGSITIDERGIVNAELDFNGDILYICNDKVETTPCES